jgi:hypothetical protein
MSSSESAVYLHFTQLIYMFGFLWYSANLEKLSRIEQCLKRETLRYLEEMDTNSFISL